MLFILPIPSRRADRDMMFSSDVAAIARDPRWLPHRYDPEFDAVHFLKLGRDDHRAATFLIDAELPTDAAKLVLERGPSLAAARSSAAPLHFISPSAFAARPCLPARSTGLVYRWR